MPSWYALSALSDARNATEDLLFPVDRGRWLRLAVIALFVGVGGGIPTGGGNANVPAGTQAPSGPGMDFPDANVVAIVAAIAVVLVALWLLWSLVGAVMEFVLVVGLRDREVSIREPFREQFRNGLRLFGFRLALGVASLLLVALPVAFVIGFGVGLTPVALVLLVPLVFVFVVVAIAVGVVLGLTTDFVVPAMLTEDRGLLDAWRRLWPTLRAQWKQVALYVVAKFVLGIAVSIVVSIALLLVLVAVAIPFAVVGALLFAGAAAAGAEHVVVFLVIPLVVLFVLVMFVAGLLIQVPAVTFVRYYTLSVLGLLVPDLDLVGVDRPDEGHGDGDSGSDDGGDDDSGSDDGGDTGDAPTTRHGRAGDSKGGEDPSPSTAPRRSSTRRRGRSLGLFL
jgi:hypothetical protein